MNMLTLRLAAAGFSAFLASTPVWADQPISAGALAQMASISAVKASLTPAQKKIDSKLLFNVLAASGDARIASFRNAIPVLAATDLAPASTRSVAATPNVKVSLVAPLSDSLRGAIAAAGGTVVYESSRLGVTNATLPLTAVSSIAERPDVSKVHLQAAPRSNVGALTSQGYITHEANKVVTQMGVNGTGVTVGVLSDSATPARVAALIASGDLPPDATSLPGQSGPSDGSDEGTAMMEIVHDLAPGARVIFATAFTSEESFADNIIALANAGCKVIVDDVTYFDEGVFQDGIVAQAVSAVTAMGVTYFSSSANSGSLTFNTSGTWEGDFLSGGPVTGVIAGGGETGLFHNFRTTASPQNYDVLTLGTQIISVKWSDPLGASTNDYDLFILNSSGTALLDFSVGAQDGTQDPLEIVGSDAGYPAGARIVVVRFSGAARAMHVDTNRGALSIATAGSTFGHNAAQDTMTTAATYWNSAKTGTRPFVGATNPNETFSSDGPRKIFFHPDGSAITAGNFLFATNGGTTLQKPDIAAADGIVTRTPGFSPFFGTSAAAPHAAGIAALVKAARPDYTPDQVKTAIRASALDSMATGVDRDSGYGIAMATRAVQYAQAH